MWSPFHVPPHNPHNSFCSASLQAHKVCPSFTSPCVESLADHIKFKRLAPAQADGQGKTSGVARVVTFAILFGSLLGETTKCAGIKMSVLVSCCSQMYRMTAPVNNVRISKSLLIGYLFVAVGYSPLIVLMRYCMCPCYFNRFPLPCMRSVYWINIDIFLLVYHLLFSAFLWFLTT